MRQGNDDRRDERFRLGEVNVDTGEQVFVRRDGGENVLQGSAEGYLEVSM